MDPNLHDSEPGLKNLNSGVKHPDPGFSDPDLSLHGLQSPGTVDLILPLRCDFFLGLSYLHVGDDRFFAEPTSLFCFFDDSLCGRSEA